MTVINITEDQLDTFLVGEPVSVLVADEDGSGQTTWVDENAEEFAEDEISALHGEGMCFWFDHPVTGKQIAATVKVV
jgi:hypothetical protein